MAAHLKVSNEQVLAAWRAWGGERPAADSLRISRPALRKRLLALGISSAKVAKAAGSAKVAKVPSFGNLPEESTGLKNALGNYPRPVGVRTVPVMQTDERQEDSLPIPTVQARVRPVRVDIPNQVALHDATQRLAKAFQVETDPTLLLNAFIQERFGAWVQEKEALAKPTRKPKAEKA